MVLLRNEGGLLPLSKDLKNVAVIGPLADSMEATEGSWMVFGHKPAAVTVLEGIRAKVPGATVSYSSGPEIRREIASFFEDIDARGRQGRADTRTSRGGLPGSRGYGPSMQSWS